MTRHIQGKYWVLKTIDLCSEFVRYKIKWYLPYPPPSRTGNGEYLKSAIILTSFCIRMQWWTAGFAWQTWGAGFPPHGSFGNGLATLAPATCRAALANGCHLKLISHSRSEWFARSNPLTPPGVRMDPGMQWEGITDFSQSAPAESLTPVG